MIQRPHKQLDVWKNSIELVRCVYRATELFPKSELFGLSSQIRRASVSIPSNIAEGLTRHSVKEKRHFLNIAQGSLSELDTQLEIAETLGFLRHDTREQIDPLVSAVGMMLSGLVRHYNKHLSS